MKFFQSAAVLISLVVALALPFPAAGHGFAGARFFPATLSTDDPFVNDELSLPTISTIETTEGRETAIAVEIAKRITPNLGIELGEEFIHLNPKHEPEASERRDEPRLPAAALAVAAAAPGVEARAPATVDVAPVANTPLYW